MIIEWIDIKEQQPECEQDVIWLYKGVAVQGWTGPHGDCIKKHDGKEAYLDDSGITHWIPLPIKPEILKAKRKQAAKEIWEKLTENMSQEELKEIETLAEEEKKKWHSETT